MLWNLILYNLLAAISHTKNRTDFRLALNHQFIIAVKEIRTDAFNAVHIRNNTNSFIIDGEGQQVPSVTSKQQPEIWPSKLQSAGNNPTAAHHQKLHFRSLLFCAPSASTEESQSASRMSMLNLWVFNFAPSLHLWLPIMEVDVRGR